jgi:enamine deaminase RidA (YjgF/YER057c/UK114 family)
LKSALQASGASFDDVVKLNSYFLDTTQLPTFREVRDKYINTSTPPASTAVKVAGLFREGFLLEVEAVAVVPE